MEVIVKPVKDSLDDYIVKNIHHFLLPLKDFSVEYINNYSLEQIKKIREKYPDIHLFISINKNIFNHEIEPLKKTLLELDKLNIKGIFFYDLALLNLKNELELKTDFVWNQTYMVTNSKTCNYYYDKGVKYAFLSKEITKDEILGIVKNSKITSIVELISYPVVAFSKRKLVKNYYENFNLPIKNNLEVIEPKTKQNYFLLEDKNGVSFILKKVMNGSKILKALLEHGVNYILLKEDLIEHEVFISCIDHINYYIHHYQNMSDLEDKAWLKAQNELLGRCTNFFYRKTIYKVK